MANDIALLARQGSQLELTFMNDASRTDYDPLGAVESWFVVNKEALRPKPAEDLWLAREAVRCTCYCRLLPEGQNTTRIIGE